MISGIVGRSWCLLAISIDVCKSQAPLDRWMRSGSSALPEGNDLTANRSHRMTAVSSIDYDELTQAALRGVVRMVLNQVVAKGGLPGEHHFYIAFNTQAPGVVMSRRLKEKYPDEMMIVLQHRFWDLAVTDEAFEVKLTFDGIPERLYIPYEAIKVFFDPSVRFTLQFGEPGAGEDAGDGAGGRRRPGEAGRGSDRRGSRHRTPKARNEGAPDSASTEVQAEGQPAQSAPASAPSPAPSPPTVFSPRPVPQAVPAPSEGEAPAKGTGAKVFSLDQFRNKK